MWWPTSCSRSRRRCSSSARHTGRRCVRRDRAAAGARAGRRASAGSSPAAASPPSGRSWRRRCRCSPEGSSAPCLGSTRPAHTHTQTHHVLHKQTLTVLTHTDRELYIYMSEYSCAHKFTYCTLEDLLTVPFIKENMKTHFSYFV